MENLYCVEESDSLIFLHYNNVYIIKYDNYIRLIKSPRLIQYMKTCSTQVVSNIYIYMK